MLDSIQPPHRRTGSQRATFLLALVLSFCALWSTALGRGDHFLVIGGGNQPSENQVSLEKNVLFFQQLLRESEGPDVLPDVFFADGLAGTRDVQFVSTEKPPRVNQLLAQIFTPDNDTFYSYRAHKIPQVRGPSNRRALTNWFNNDGAHLGDGDRLFIYFTGHGGPGRPERNTTLAMWEDRSLNVMDFSSMLDRLSPKVQVVLLMVQCHAGGFADVIFRDGRPGPRLSSARRCGFFATTFDRQAAGCTADIDEDDYHDYSTSFLAALGGKTRTGQRVAPPDYNGDGHVSFAEAHAYVLLHSDTVDVPVTTSDVLLRQFSRQSGTDLLSADGPFEEMIQHASPSQRAILEGLSEQLELKGNSRTFAARNLADRLDAQRKQVQKQRQQRFNDRDGMAAGLRNRLTRRWPELSNPWSPRVAELLQKQGEAIQRYIESDRLYSRFDGARQAAGALDEKDLDLERNWVKCQRFLYTAQSVVLAANLEKIADPAIVKRYQEMIADEAGTLPQNTVPAAAMRERR